MVIARQFLFSMGFLFVGLASLHAQPRDPDLSFNVNVRAIGAFGVRGEENTLQTREIEVDDRLVDIREKLVRLPYSSFRLIGYQDGKVAMRQRDRLRLLNGQSLVVRPIEFNQDSITMWLRWDDRDGMNILDTRLHFSYGESMLAGVEGQEDTGVILAINVSPAVR